MDKKRIGELDFLRTAAFLAVVMQHVLGVYVNNYQYKWEAAAISVVFLLSKFAVPAFVFISGLVLFYNYYDKFNYIPFIIKRIKEILIPYFIWTVLYYLYYNLRNAPSISGFLKALALGKGGYHLWYVVMIFQFYLLIKIFISFFKGIQKLAPSKNKQAVLFCLFTLFYVALILLPSYFTPQGIFKPQNQIIKFIFVDFATRNSIFYIFYFVAGAVAGLNLERFRALLKRHTVILTAIFITGFIALELLYYKNGFTNAKLNVIYPSFFKPHYFLFTVVMIMFLYRLALTKAFSSTGAQKLFSLIGACSFQAYLAHAYLLNKVAGILYKTQLKLRPMLYALVFLGCVISSLIVGFIITKGWKYIKQIYIKTKARQAQLNYQ